jgi:hypothetical protein
MKMLFAQWWKIVGKWQVISAIFSLAIFCIAYCFLSSYKMTAIASMFLFLAIFFCFGPIASRKDIFFEVFLAYYVACSSLALIAAIAEAFTHFACTPAVIFMAFLSLALLAVLVTIVSITSGIIARRQICVGEQQGTELSKNFVSFSYAAEFLAIIVPLCIFMLWQPISR